MRNLKKFLALVLAMMMTLSLMVTVNAAKVEFPDSGDVNEKFAEAVEVLTGMGVFKGTEENGQLEFLPKSNVTRAQMAAVVYRLATGDDEDVRVHLYKEFAEFPDVDKDAWYAGYVGYCADAQIIKGYSDHRFYPNKEVTGYEALAMLLRAVGYGKNGEFEGTNWRVNVGARATSEKMLKNVNATNYASSLNQIAVREMLAEITFQAAQLPTVTWTQLGEYNKYNNLLGNTEDELNPSLGLKFYGLTNVSRIVVGNQATGENCTVLGTEGGTLTAAKDGEADKTVTFDYSEYAYPGATVPKANFSDTAAADGTIPVSEGIKLDWETGLGMFGHRVNVWYNADSGAIKETYAVSDAAELSAVVKATADGSLADVTPGTDDGKLGLAAKNEGFAKGAATDTVYMSASFSRIGGGDDGAATATDKTTGAASISASSNTSTVFVLISNNANKKVDVVIPVVLDVGEISQVNNQINEKTLAITGASNIDMEASDAVKQSKVMNPEAIKLGNTVVATKITARTNDPSDGSVYWLDTPTTQVTKKLVAIDSVDKTITCDDGTEYKRTIIADEHLVSGNTNVTSLNSTNTTYAEYVITLDMQGNWLNAVRAYDNNFVYGTYLDWSTTLGSSKFTYRLVGVDLDGNRVEKDITGWRGVGDASNAAIKTLGNAAGDVGQVGLPHRDDMDDTGMKGRSVGTIEYKGYIVNGSTASNRNADLETVAGIQSFGDDIESNDNGATITGSDFISSIGGGLSIDAKDLKLGVKLVTEGTSTDARGTGLGSKLNLYLTENTKFIVVGGYGTDTQTIDIYNGLTDLLGQSGSVTITAADANVANEILYTSAPYVYANTGASAREVKTIFIPDNCVTRTGTSNMYFFPNKSTVVDSDDNTVHLFTAYQDGEKVTVWINDAGKTAIETNIDASKYGSFQNLEDTSSKASDGRPIYKLATIPAEGAPDNGAQEVWTGSSYAGVAFKGTTNNGLSCIVKDDTDKLAGTANVKVVNLVDGYTINDINDLNEVASVSTTVTVDIAYAAAGDVQIATIYVVKIA